MQATLSVTRQQERAVANSDITPLRYRQARSLHGVPLPTCVLSCTFGLQLDSHTQGGAKCIMHTATPVTVLPFTSMISSGDTYKAKAVHRRCFFPSRAPTKAITPAQTGNPRGKPSPRENLAHHPSRVALPISSLQSISDTAIQTARFHPDPRCRILSKTSGRPIARG